MFVMFCWPWATKVLKEETFDCCLWKRYTVHTKQVKGNAKESNLTGKRHFCRVSKKFLTRASSSSYCLPCLHLLLWEEEEPDAEGGTWEDVERFKPKGFVDPKWKGDARDDELLVEGEGVDRREFVREKGPVPGPLFPAAATAYREARSVGNEYPEWGLSPDPPEDLPLEGTIPFMFKWEADDEEEGLLLSWDREGLRLQSMASLATKLKEGSPDNEEGREEGPEDDEPDKRWCCREWRDGKDETDAAEEIMDEEEADEDVDTVATWGGGRNEEWCWDANCEADNPDTWLRAPANDPFKGRASLALTAKRCSLLEFSCLIRSSSLSLSCRNWLRHDKREAMS